MEVPSSQIFPSLQMRAPQSRELRLVFTKEAHARELARVAGFFRVSRGKEARKTERTCIFVPLDTTADKRIAKSFVQTLSEDFRHNSDCLSIRVVAKISCGRQLPASFRP